MYHVLQHLLTFPVTTLLFHFFPHPERRTLGPHQATTASGSAAQPPGRNSSEVCKTRPRLLLNISRAFQSASLHFSHFGEGSEASFHHHLRAHSPRLVSNVLRQLRPSEYFFTMRVDG